MNNVILIGRLTKDPELEYTHNQNAVCRFTLAVDRINEGADFIRITTWNKQAESCHRYLAKGRQAAIMGHITTGSYKKDGQTIYTTDVVADRVEFIGDKGDNSRSDGRKYESGNTYQPEPQNANYGDFSTLNEPVPF